jgi:hypothetical protein
MDKKRIIFWEICRKRHRFFGFPHTRLGIIAHPFFKEIILALQTNVFHKRERIGGIPEFRITELQEESVGYVFNVLTHHLGIHSNERTSQCVRNKFRRPSQHPKNFLVHDPFQRQMLF